MKRSYFIGVLLTLVFGASTMDKKGFYPFDDGDEQTKKISSGMGPKGWPEIVFCATNLTRSLLKVRLKNLRDTTHTCHKLGYNQSTPPFTLGISDAELYTYERSPHNRSFGDRMPSFEGEISIHWDGFETFESTLLMTVLLQNIVQYITPRGFKLGGEIKNYLVNETRSTEQMPKIFAQTIGFNKKRDIKKITLWLEIGKNSVQESVVDGIWIDMNKVSVNLETSK
jgi:hypothetical protein